jgi:DNA polymerase I-like protein with 3'-5' exonuclease and polymerase domains
MQLPLFDLPSDWTATSVSDLPSWADAARLGLDTETCDPNLNTTGPSVRTGGFIAGISFAIEDGPSEYLPVRHFGGGNLPEEEVMRYLRGEAKKFKGILVGANLNYDLDYLEEAGIVFPNIKGQRDIQIADPLINELHLSYSLEAIGERWGLPAKDEEHLRKAAMHYGLDPKADLWKLPAKHVGVYATADAVNPLRILRRQERVIEDEGLWEIFKLECELQPVLLQMRRWGIRVDQAKLNHVEEWAIEEEEKQLQEIKRITGRTLNVGDVNKKPALLSVLQAVGVELTAKTDGGEIKLDKHILGAIEHPVADLIHRAKKMDKLRNTFVSSIRRHMVNGRIHSTFNQLRATREQGDEKGARYGRMSSVDPNLQQQPSRDDFADLWRSIYVPDEPGQLFCSADYSQQEPRMTTHFAELMGYEGAYEMAERFRTDPTTDNHDMMTLMIHPELAHLDRKDPDFLKVRKPTKDIFLGLCYGMGQAKLARTVGLPTAWEINAQGRKFETAGPEARALFNKFHRAVPYVKLLSDRCKKKAEKHGVIVTILGRHCHFPRMSNGQYDWTHKALNRLIQGSSGDQTKRAVIELARAGLLPQLQVHDEVCRGVDSMKQAYEIKEIMEHCVELTVPSRVDLEIGPSWGEAEEIAA